MNRNDQVDKNSQNDELQILTVTLNPAFDVFCTVDTVHPGALHRVGNMAQYAGGKGINVSKALHAFSIPTLATGFLGGRRGQWIAEQLEQADITHDFVIVQEETRMNVKVSATDGQLTEFNSQVSNFSSVEWDELETKLWSYANSGRWITFAGRLPQGCDLHWYEKEINSCKQQGAKTVLDTSGDAFRYGVEALPHLIKPNVKELAAYTGEELLTVDEVAQAAQLLVNKGIETVVVSLGERGLVASCAEETIYVEVPRLPVQSTVGAGDTVVAGLLYGSVKHMAFADRMAFAAAAGSAAVMKYGTQQPELNEVYHLLPSIRVTTLSGGELS